MTIFSMSLWAAGITLFIGGATFIYTLNRQLNMADLQRGQVSRTQSAFLVWIGGALALALVVLLFPGAWLRLYLLAACAPLGIILAGEVRLVAQRLRYRGSQPEVRRSLRFSGGEFVPASLPPSSILRPVTTTDLQVLSYAVTCRAAMENAGPDTEIPLKVVAASDFHLHPKLPSGYFARVIEQMNLQQPDLIFLPGDFVTHLEDSGCLVELLSSLKAPLGVYASLGNHDYWAGVENVKAMVRQAGITLLSNRNLELEYVCGMASVPMTLSGCDDPWGSPPWAPPQLKPDQLWLVLSHTSDNIYRLIQYPVAAVFSGHCHAGQVRIPGFGSVILPSAYGRRFDYGHFRFRRRPGQNPVHLFVSAGTGAANPPWRIYCQPELFVVNFKVLPL